MVEEPEEEKWHIELERVKSLAEKVSGTECHLKYILFIIFLKKQTDVHYSGVMMYEKMQRCCCRMGSFRANRQ